MTEIDARLAEELIEAQFPQWRHLPVVPVEKSGHDNRTFRLGEEFSIRLPSHECYAGAVEKEARWLPVLAGQLSLPVPFPVAQGKPTPSYPLPWSVNRWLNGEPVSPSNVEDMDGFARDLARFLLELEAVDAAGGPPAGAQNCHRGGNLAVYDEEARNAIEHLSGEFDAGLLTEIWQRSLATKYMRAPVWVHGDVAAGNLLVQNGKLCGVIDFGTSGVGDPACDLVMAWNFFDAKSREMFFGRMGVDGDMINCARGWALWKALITCDGNEKGSELAVWGKSACKAIIEEYRAR